MNGFSVHVLLYGNYLKLAKRCLGSIIETRDNDLIGELRVGLNEVAPETRKLVIEGLKDLPFPVWIYECRKNALKYPLMRRMFYDPTRLITLPYIMWFDDDSCIVAKDKSWWTRATPFRERLHEGQRKKRLWLRSCFHSTKACLDTNNKGRLLCGGLIATLKARSRKRARLSLDFRAAKRPPGNRRYLIAPSGRLRAD